MDNNLQQSHEPLYTDWPGARFKEPILYGDTPPEPDIYSDYGDRKFDIPSDIVRLGKFGINADSWLGRLCQFADWLEERNLLTHKPQEPSLSFDGRHFAQATLASHIAYFAAANYPYGISPSKAAVTTHSWVEDHIDLFNDAYVLVNKYEDEDESTEIDYDRFRVDPYPPMDWLRDNNHRISLAFSHQDGIDCLHRALGIDSVPEEVDKMLFRSVVDSTISGTLHNVDPLHAASPWTQEWVERDDYTLGHLLWRSFMLIRDELKRFFTKHGFHQAALQAASYWHVGHEVGKHNSHRLHQLAAQAEQLARKHKQLKMEAC